MLPFLQNFLMGFYSDGPCECMPLYGPSLKSVALPVPEIIAIAVLGGVAGLQTPNLGEEEAI